MVLNAEEFPSGWQFDALLRRGMWEERRDLRGLIFDSAKSGSRLRNRLPSASTEVNQRFPPDFFFSQ